MKVEVNRNAKSRRPSNRRAWKYWHPNAQWLADEIMRKQPKHCFCGHIHSGCHGIQEFNGMKFSNVSLVNEDYVVSYKPLYLNV